MVNMKSNTENRKPYSGLTRSLVIAIDVGTTFSGVSYAILEPGEIPKIHGVTRFPGQEHVAGNTKIPSVIYYDKHGKMMAAGAEAETSSIQAQAEDEGWIRTELFKLRLRPRTMQLNMNGMHFGPLPRKKTAVHVFGDFLAYLYRCTRNFITDTHGNGAALWNAVENNIQFVLSHPNGWEGAQQTKMRRAAVYGGLIPETNEGKARIRFVTEGEASLHACVLSGLADDVLSNPSKHGFLIADAGGGTLDISAYAIRGTAPLVMEEVAPPDCIFAGSVFVSRRARQFLEEKLKNSKYGTPAALDHITQRFDETTKRLFRDRDELQFVHFGSPLDKDLTVGIRSGQLKLTGNEVANLFEPSVDAAVGTIKAQIRASNGIIRSVFLVGGYAASPWLFSQLQERLAPLKITVSRPDTQTSKAVADGAIGFYCDHHVAARMSKFMYGVEFLRELDPTNPDHIARKERLCELPSGPKLLPDAFDCILSRSVKVKESTVFTRKYCTELTSLSMLSVFEVEIWCYRGGSTVPKWIDRLADDFSTLCVVQADLSPLSGSAEPKAGKNGKTYWTIIFSVEIHFGLTEFRARIKWIDDGKTKYGPASIIYNERGHRAEEEEPDAYPEDDVGVSSPRNDRLRSEPSSRARTPIEQFYHPPISENRGFDQPHPRAEQPIEIPQVVRERNISTSRRPASPPMVIQPRKSPPSPPKDIEKEAPQDKKKGKGKDRTPKATPKLEEIPPPTEPPTTASPQTQQPADTFPPSSSLWTTDPGAISADSFSNGWGQPSPFEKNGFRTVDSVTPKVSPALGVSHTGFTPSIIPTKQEKDPLSKAGTPKATPGIGVSIGLSPSFTSKHERAQTNSVTPKVSPGIGASRVGISPSTISEKLEATSKTSPAVEATFGLSEPIVAAETSTPAAPLSSNGAISTDKTPPTTSITKKGKKKNALAAVIPTAEVAESAIDSLANTAVVNNTSTPEGPKTKETDNALTPVGLPEVTLSTKTPEAGSLMVGDDISSSLFGSSAWDNTNNKDVGISDDFDSWGSPFNKPKTPKTPKSRQTPKTPVADTMRTATTPVAPETTVAVALTSETTPPLDTTTKTSASTPAKTAEGLGWGTSVAKKPGLGVGTSSTGWGTSFGGAKAPETKTPSKSPWASKLTTPVTNKTPVWGAETSIFDKLDVGSKEPTETPAGKAEGPEASTGDQKTGSPLIEPPTVETSGVTTDANPSTEHATKPTDEPSTPAAEKIESSKATTPQPEEKGLNSAADDPVELLGDNDAAEDKDEDKKAGGAAKKGGGGGGGGGGTAAKKKKKGKK